MVSKTIIVSKDTREIVESSFINWDYYKNSTILITGATGLIGSQIVWALISANKNLNTNIKIIALVRDMQKVKAIFPSYLPYIKFIKQDIKEQLVYKGNVDYIIHTANTTSSKEMFQNPSNTIDTIINGTKNILEFAKKKKVKSLIYLSSMEVYGEIPIDKNIKLKESDYGYLDILKPRNSYPEGKRSAESLCAAYYYEFGLPVKIARLSQIIGAAVDYDDNRVFAQFARNIVEKQDIVLKTKGETIRSYCYITDAVIAILAMLEKGKNGNSYNVANPDTTCSIKEMAEMLCKKYPSSKVCFDLNQNTDYYLKVINYYLDISELQNITGWKPFIGIEEAFSRLISSFIYKKNFVYSNTNFINKLIIDFKKYLKNRFINSDINFNTSLAYMLYYRFQPLDKNKIVFSNFCGKSFGCNPKYIVEEILRRKLPYEIVWFVDNRDKEKYKKIFPDEVNLQIFQRQNVLRELSQAKLWIDNNRMSGYFQNGLKKRKNQYYIQTWHGSLGIKKLDADVKNFNNPIWLKYAKLDSLNMDYLLTNSIFEERVLSSALFYNNKLLKSGHPRNDIFFKDCKNIIKKVKDYYNLKFDTKLVLYVPSFRDTGIIDCYNLDYQRLLDALAYKFGGDWKLLIRLHPRISALKEHLISKQNNIINATDYPDIQELLVTSDVAITDYSSCIFDFMLSRKPAFIYAEDIEKYKQYRGFYYPLESTPFPIAQNNEELAKNIESFDYENYRQKVEMFLEDKGCYEDGHAAERVVDLIEEIMSKK